MKLKRSMAFLIDAILLWFVFVIGSGFIISLIKAASPDAAEWAVQNSTLGAFVLLIVFYLLFCLRDSFVSLGKLIFGLRVYSLDGGKATFKQRFLRNITMPILQVEIVILFVLGKRLGDMLAKTTVQTKKWRREDICQEK